jgi:C1A family cysteine protease
MRSDLMFGLMVCLIGAFGNAAGQPPEAVDWVARGVVSPVKDQGLCGGDYAFATAAAVNSAHAIFKKGLADVSEQQILDCSGSYGGHGCEGADLESGFKYIVAHGFTTSAAYPYQQNSGTCKINGGKSRIKSYSTIPDGNCSALQAAVAQQPVVVAVDASNWDSYKGGVFSDCGTNVNHAVLVVGYTPDYWIVQNEWGTAFGENGYIRLKRGNTCGICSMGAYPRY